MQINLVEKKDATCFGYNDGIAEIIVENGLPTYSYKWNDSITSNSACNSLKQGINKVTVTDFNGCSVSKEIEIGSPSKLFISNLSVISPLCNGYSTGSIWLAAQGGVGTYSYLWSTGAQTNSLENKLAGNYKVKVTDENSCSLDTTIALPEPDSIIIIITSIKIPSCVGSLDGSMKIQPSGGMAPYITNWKTVSDIILPEGTNFKSGMYVAEVEDKNGCTASKSYNLVDPETISFNLKKLTSPLCFGGSDGEIAIKPDGGSQPYKIIWNNIEGSDTLKNARAGKYFLNIVDANGCNHFDSIVLHQTSPLKLNLSILNEPNCSYSNDGEILASAVGGVFPYLYYCNNIPVENSIKNLRADKYEVRVTDKNSCSNSAVVALNSLSKLKVSQTIAKSPSCFGLSDGVIQMNATGGVLPYKYILGKDTNSFGAFSNLPANIYTVKITDLNSCLLESQPIMLSAPDSIDLLVDYFLPKCYNSSNGSIKVIAKNAIQPVSYYWPGIKSNLNIASGLSAGKHEIVVTDANNCKITRVLQLNNPDSLYINSINVIQPSCYGLSDGSINVSAKGGKFPYSFKLKDELGLYTNSATGLKSGKYIVEVNDSNHCNSEKEINISSPSEIKIQPFEIKGPKCNNDSNGTIKVFADGGLGFSYSYLLKDELSGDTINCENSLIKGGIFSSANLKSGIYSVLVTNNNCSSFRQFELHNPTPIQVSGQLLKEPSCFGYSDGLIELTVPRNDYSFFWNNKPGTSKYTNIPAGVYNCTITDTSRCSVNYTFNLNQPDSLITDLKIIDPTCYGLDNGSITVIASGGKQPYRYEWKDNSSYIRAERNNLSNGNYSIRVHYGNSCFKDVLAKLTQPDLLKLSISSLINPKCYGSTDGEINVNVEGGRPTYSIRWRKEDDQQVFNSGLNLKAGLYKIEAIDKNNCQENTYAQLKEPDQLKVKTIKTDPTCFGYTNGKLVLEPNGGILPYSCLINGVTSGMNLENLSKGIYKFQIKDANKCIYSDSVEITEPEPISYTSEIKEPSCYGLSNGSLNIKATGGKLPFTYSLNNEKGGPIYNCLSSGDYSLIIKDVNNCNLSSSINISEPQPIKFEKFNIENPTCYNYSDGKFNVVVTGGSQPYSYKWYSDGLTYISGDSLMFGNYTLKVDDKRNCSLTYSAILNNPQRLTMSVFDENPSCFGEENGSLKISPFGGTGNYNYYLNSAPAQAYNTNLKKGIYRIETVDENNCKVSDEKELKDPVSIRIDTIIRKYPSCYGYSNGSLEIRASGGNGIYKYRLDGIEGIGLFNSLISKKYFIEVFDSNNCTISQNFELEQPQSLQFANIILNKPSCFNFSNGSIETLAIGGNPPYNYSIFQTKTHLLSGNNLAAGNYTISVTDKNNCTLQTNQVLSNPSPLSISFIKKPPQCFGFNNGSIIASIKGGNGGYSYFWNNSNGDSALGYLTTGNYHFKVVDNKGCTDSVLVNLAEPDELKIEKMVSRNPLCFGSHDGSIEVIATGGSGLIRYFNGMSESSSLFTKLPAGEYNISAVDTNNCISSVLVSLQQPDSLYFASIDIHSPTCFGENNGAINAIIKGGTGSYKLRYNYGDTVLTYKDSLIAGNLNIDVTDENGCKVSKPVIITSPPPIKPIIFKNLPSCFGLTDGSIEVSATGGSSPLSFQLNGINNTTQLSDIGKGSYPLLITDASNCIHSQNIELNEPAKLQINNIVAISPHCYNTATGSINFNITGGTGAYTSSLNFNNSNLPFTGLAAGNYTVSVTDTNNCYTGKQINLVYPDTLYLNIEKIFNTTCPGTSDGAFAVSAKGKNYPLVISYFNNNNEQVAAPIDLVAGEYHALVTDNVGCVTAKEVKIESPASISLPLIEYSKPSCYGYLDGSIKISPAGGYSPYYYLWSDGSPLGTISNIGAGNYSVKVNDSWGCSITKELGLSNPELLTIESALTTNPLCYKGNNGNIHILPKGGTTPYSYSWSNNGRTARIDSLKAGAYSLKLTDANNCYASASYSLSDPPKIVGTGIPASATICPNTKYTIEPGQQWINCSWKSDKGFKSNQRKIEISEPGKYFLTALNADYCSVLDTFHLIVDSSLLRAMFLMKSEAKYADTVVIIEVSQPVPDYVKWVFPDSVSRIYSEYSKEAVSFGKEGINEVSLVAWLGECTDTVSRKILILPSPMKKQAPAIDTPAVETVKQFDISPNPCKGYFNLNLSLNDESPAEISIVSINGVVLSNLKVKGLKQYNLQIDVSKFKPGNYFIKLRSKKFIEYRSLIIKN
jgi:hypothetical protein